MSVKARPQLQSILRREYEELKRQDYLRLDMSENINGLPADFVSKVTAELTPEFLSMYPSYHRLEEKIAQHVNLSTKHIYVSNSSDVSIKDIFTAFISPNDQVVLTDPTFEMCFIYSKVIGAEAKVISYKSDLTFDDGKFLAAITKNTKMAFIVNPNNPIGNLIDEKVLLRIIEKTQKTNTLLVIDEAYHYFCPKTLIDLVNKFNHVIVVRTFSKFMGLASVRIGFAAACPDIITSLKKVRPTFDVNGVAAKFVERLLDSPNVIKSMIKEYEEGKKYILHKLDSHKIPYFPTDCNLLLLKCDGRVFDMLYALKENKILTRGMFRQSFLKPYLRINMGGIKEMERFFNVFHKLWFDK